MRKRLMHLSHVQRLNDSNDFIALHCRNVVCLLVCCSVRISFIIIASECGDKRSERHIRSEMAYRKDGFN